MFNLFASPLVTNKQTYLERDYREVLVSIQTLFTYYASTNYRVHNDHILVRVINLLMNSYTDDRQFIKSVQVQTDSVGLLGINTAYRAGRILDDPFVGGLHKCMIYLDETSMTNVSPVRVLSHPFTHTRLPLLDGKMLELDLEHDIYNSYVSTYAISSTSLMFKYKRYLETMPKDSAMTGPAHFVYTRVLPHMLLSFYQLSLFNRLAYPLQDKRIIDAPNRHRLKTLNLTYANQDKQNSVRELRSYGIAQYSDILLWQLRRGYGLSPLGTLPPSLHIYRPTAAIAWLSRADMITSLLLIGGSNVYKKQGEYIRELNYQYKLTLNGRFITDPEARAYLNPLLTTLLDAQAFIS